MEKSNLFRPGRRGLVIAAFIMILFGGAEVATAFTHEFFGLTTSQTSISTYLGAAIGLLYILSGVFLFPFRKWGAALAILCLAMDVAGRIAMVAAGFYPIDTSKQTFSIIAGTLIAAAFAIYIGARWKAFE